MSKVSPTCPYRGPWEQVCHTGQDPVAILCVRNYSLTSAATEVLPWLGVLIARVCLWRPLIAQQHLLPSGLGNETVGHFPKEPVHITASACVGFLPIPVTYQSISWLWNLEFKDTFLPRQAMVCFKHTPYVVTSEGTKSAIWLFSSGFCIWGSPFAYWHVNVTKIKACLQKM